jgi:hypothetical protein
MSVFTPTGTNQERETVLVNGRKAKTFSEWQEYRRSNPRHYFSTSTQKRLMEDVQALGEETFFSTQTKEDV